MEELLRTEGLKVHFPSKGGDSVHAVDGVDLSVYKGEVLGLVGESGCGKSTFGKSVLGLLEASSGHIYFKGENIREWSAVELRRRRKNMQMIFQDPFSSLNPRMKVSEIIGEPLEIHDFPKERRKDRIAEILESVGMSPDAAGRFPHQFSGGQRQRIGIARALSVEPEFIVADEAVSALDVSVQAQIINLMAELRDRFSLTYLFIAHDLRVVEYISKRIAIMYLGRIVETGLCEEVYSFPKHPYTKALISSIPEFKKNSKIERIVLSGDPPSPVNLPSGCSFHPRCPIAEEHCRVVRPELRPLGESQFAACHLA